MSTRTIRRLACIGVAALAPLLLAGVASADEHPSHDGPPRSWGPPLAAICAGGPAAALAAGYNVIEGDDFANVITGTVLADAIFAYGDNDTVRGGPNVDLLCLGKGDDRGRGDAANDAVFGEEGRDRLLGDDQRDYLNGGAQFDQCNGGLGLDASALCEVNVSVP